MKLFLVGVLNLFLANFCIASTHASKDTVSLTLPQVEQIFIARNLNLLASKYSIEEARALIRQSKLWDNPSLYLEQNIYNSTNGKYLDASYNGQSIVQFQQLFSTAGKRNKRIKMAEINTKINDYQFFDLLRTLKYDLRSTFYDIYFSSKTIKTFDRELITLRRNVAVFDTLTTKGIISMKESVRLKAFLFSLENDRLEVLKNLISQRQHLSVLLNDTTLGFVEPIVDFNFLDKVDISQLTLPALKDSAALYRYDLKAAKENLNYEKMNNSYQRALAYPDMKLGGVYDRQGSFIRDYTGVTLQFDMPVFNRNQGNIAASNYRVKQSTAQVDAYTLLVGSEVQETYLRSFESVGLYKSFDNKFLNQFNMLTEGVLRNYQKRNISILEFIDFFESYKNGLIQINKMHLNVINALEELNYVTGTNLFKY